MRKLLMQKSVDIPIRAKKLLHVLILDKEKSLGFLDLFHFRLSFLIKYDEFLCALFYGVSKNLEFIYLMSHYFLSKKNRL